MKQLAFITDIHLDEQFPKDNGVDARKNWQWILNDVKSKCINEIIFGGDIGDTSANPWFFESLKNFNLKMVLGNHDHYKTVTEFYKQVPETELQELFYFQEDECFKSIFLDSSSAMIGSVQLNWLKNQLMTEKKIALFVHHPILKVDTAVDQLYPLKNREEVKAILLHSKKEIILFCGHYHMEDRTKENNITQFITPAASYQIKKNKKTLMINNEFFAYRIIQWDETKITSRLVTKVITQDS